MGRRSNRNRRRGVGGAGSLLGLESDFMNIVACCSFWNERDFLEGWLSNAWIDYTAEWLITIYGLVSLFWFWTLNSKLNDLLDNYSKLEVSLGELKRGR